MYLMNSWYVIAWQHEVETVGQVTGRTILDQPIVLWRGEDGRVHAWEDRCPHRHAPLSLGRVEGDRLRCMYHGMMFDAGGRCVHVPSMASPPKDVAVRVYPASARHDWIWIWMGDPAMADPGLIPDVLAYPGPAVPIQPGMMEYGAHYQLVHDNLCDMSHLDFVHETTLGAFTGARWSASSPRVRVDDRSVSYERWFPDAPSQTEPGARVDVWSAYRFVVPGLMFLTSARFPPGTTAAFGGGAPDDGVEPISHNVEQQAVTPISADRTLYLYGTRAFGKIPANIVGHASRMDMARAAFDEDRRMIQGQQRIWELTDPATPKTFLPQDKGAHLFRQIMRRLIEREAACVREAV